MRSSLSRSWFTMAAWCYVAPFVAIGALALLVLAFGGLAAAVQVLAVLLKRLGI